MTYVPRGGARPWYSYEGMHIDADSASARMALNLKRILQERHIKQSEFAQAIGYSTTHLNQVLQLTKRMSMDMVDAVTRTLKLDPSDLLRHSGAVELPPDLHTGARLPETLQLMQDAPDRESGGTHHAVAVVAAALEARLAEVTQLRSDFTQVRDDMRAAAQYLVEVSEQVNERVAALVAAEPGEQRQVARVIQPVEPEFHRGSRRKASKKGRRR